MRRFGPHVLDQGRMFETKPIVEILGGNANDLVPERVGRPARRKRGEGLQPVVEPALATVAFARDDDEPMPQVADCARIFVAKLLPDPERRGADARPVDRIIIETSVDTPEALRSTLL